MPLQCDNVPDGVRVAVIRTSANRIASMGELTFTVVEALDPVDQLLNKDAPPGLSVQVRLRGNIIELLTSPVRDPESLVSAAARK